MHHLCSDLFICRHCCSGWGLVQRRTNQIPNLQLTGKKHSRATQYGPSCRPLQTVCCRPRLVVPSASSQVGPCALSPILVKFSTPPPPPSPPPPPKGGQQTAHLGSKWSCEGWQMPVHNLKTAGRTAGGLPSCKCAHTQAGSCWITTNRIIHF